MMVKELALLAGWQSAVVTAPTFGVSEPINLHVACSKNGGDLSKVQKTFGEKSSAVHVLIFWCVVSEDGGEETKSHV